MVPVNVYRALTPPQPRRRRRLPAPLALGVVLMAVVGGAAAAQAAPAEPAGADLALAVQAQVRQMADRAVAGLQGLPAGAKVSVDVGAVDSRLKLAACRRTEPFLPPGARLWGRAKVGVRCIDGDRPWQVWLPVTVKVLAPSLVAAGALPAGTVLTAAHLASAEVDLAEGSPAVRASALALGRTLARPLAAGAALREADLRARLWFAAGETVTVVAIGPGFRITGSGTALSPGVAGQRVRVRTDQGRILVGEPVADGRVEVTL